ncbi:rRNA maturation RNase YbeY [Defluviimonas sp. WL0075]|uniref:Endoribonuclease YbeY n=1 Tax=Albidovulum sediminicola TaxID=2984331 RepID=A0ABT2YXK0_9RHOB|nr:rRNA maturation RNase YbeY [Defluviimonas sp. WL0075]MCV2863583.1 rRNA maturation RNase YbeY [Defluviimonas sp. WL0075]
MEPLVDTLIEDARWDAFGLEDLAEEAARATLAALGLAASGFEISLLGCDDRRIADLNADYRGKPQPTNVLSWPSDERAADEDGAAPDLPDPGPEEMPEELGDIAIAWETCEREAVEQGKPLRDHVTHLLVHGTLHLLGYDHIRDGDAALMEGTEVRILEQMGLANPYE